MITRNCNNCQEEYEAEPRYLNRGQGLFCSRTCSAAYHAEAKRVKHEPNTQCSWCGIDFYRQESHKNSKSGHHYCCSEHQTLGAASGLHSTGPKANLQTSPPRICLLCLKPLNKRARKTSIMHQPCSRNLVKAYLINQWLNGDNDVTLYKSKSSSTPIETRPFVKEYLLDTRGDKCEECGWDRKAPDGRSIIQMDHINGDCFDNRLENLKLLCPNHHAMTPTYGSLNRGSGRSHRRKGN